MIIAWWSGGVTSAVACKLSADLFGIEKVRFVFIDTKNEDVDTYRFKMDCEKWYGKEIETITNDSYSSIQDIWLKYLSLNVAHGAVCSTDLKRKVRIKFQKENQIKHQVFGFEFESKEFNRALAMSANNPDSKSIYPLLMFGYTKKDCISIIESAGIEIPMAYKLGLNNNNCLNTGCVQGGIGYWQMMKELFPDKFDRMALMEHTLTDKKGKPVTMLKDQSRGGGLVFLKPHPDYPNIKDISMMKGRKPEPLKECNGHCGINDLNKPNNTQTELNYE